MMRREKFAIANIYVPVKRRATLQPETVQEIAQSMLEVGQQAPILVRRDGDRFVLVHGLHRLEACKALGEETIYGYLEVSTMRLRLATLGQKPLWRSRFQRPAGHGRGALSCRLQAGEALPCRGAAGGVGCPIETGSDAGKVFLSASSSASSWYLRARLAQS